MRTKITTFILGLLSVIFLFNVNVFASTPTDEITDYEITADVNEDASVTLTYHIEWLVLESDQYGPVDWVKIGIPNSVYNDYQALSDNIDSMSISSSGGSYALVYFKDKYYKDETVAFDFSIVLPNMYQVNKYTEGYTVYSFTPGWFDDIAVDNLTIRWNADKLNTWTPECFIENGYAEWNTSLAAGSKFTVELTYPNDAFSFDMSRTGEVSEDGSSELGPVASFIVGAIAVIIVLLVIFVPIALPFVLIGVIAYAANRGLGKSYKKEITRTKIVYYPSCQGCGAVRKEGEKFCGYCGRSFVKSEEKITESQIPEEESALRKKVSNGEYRYSSSPDTYIRVNVVRIPVVRPTTTTHSSCVHSSCAHSSCAHSSCACACACACAGGGRAGCTNKDFYRTNLKLSYLEKRNKAKEKNVK